MRTADFDYQLPEELIAQFPTGTRGESRMLALEKRTGKCDLCRFKDIGDFLQSGDCAVFNNTKVMQARIYGRKSVPDGAKIEILLISEISPGRWKCFIRPRKRIKQGMKIFLEKNGTVSSDFFTIKDLPDDGSCEIEFESPDVFDLQEKYGHIPLPPYIKRPDEIKDKETYQTVYAKTPGAVAAPTAGLHFTDEILSQLSDKGVKTAELTLHVGPGTFKPVSVDNLSEHKMHVEEFTLPEKVAELINSTRQNGAKALAVGTTTLRALESSVDANGRINAKSGRTDIFIHPPYKPKSAEMLLTNFHLPKSTLLMLVSAFAGQENIMNAYQLAIKEKFRFYSYGDCMLLY
jgi:S-adenosylmethionine:tRNA ribosyltransferase-isomerase